MRFQKKKKSSYLRFEKTDFLRFQIAIFKMQFPNDLYSGIRFEIALIVYEITILNAP
jgi:hypothetical protein